MHAAINSLQAKTSRLHPPSPLLLCPCREELTGRWGLNPKILQACVVAEQRTYLLELCQVWNLQLSQDDVAEEVCNSLCAMSRNV